MRTIASRFDRKLSSEIAEARPWVVPLARIGYAARAVLYVMLGGLAYRRSIYHAARPDLTAALSALRDSTAGPIVLGAMAVGLWGYMIWRWVEAIDNPERRGTVHRIDIAVRGVLYGWFGLDVIRFVLGTPIEAHPARHWTSLAVAHPVGAIVLWAVGFGFVWFAASEALHAVKGEISRHLESSAPSYFLPWVLWAGRIGMAARAALFGLVAIGLLRAAATLRSQHALDFSDAMQQIATFFGSSVLAIVGAGLISYGVYLIALARWRRMPV